MTILDNLIEKKDILNYLKFRIKTLTDNRKQIVKDSNKEDRERLANRMSFKIIELQRLLILISEGKLKEDCKKMWKQFDEDYKTKPSKPKDL